MTITLLYSCCQIETCTADLAATRQFLSEVLGAVPVEQELARQIAGLMPGTGYDVDHLECGGAVFQINQPARGMEFAGQKSIHQAYLDAGGPCVTNLNFYVDDIAHARSLLTELGAATHIEGPSDIAPALGVYGPGNTRAGAHERPFLFMGTRHLIGFDLEIMEPNFWHLERQSVQYPAFMEPRPAPTADWQLSRLVVEVADVAATWSAIERIFAPASRGKPYDIATSPNGPSFRMSLGGLELEYRQPCGTNPQIASHLERFGPGVSTVVFERRRGRPDSLWDFGRGPTPSEDTDGSDAKGPIHGEILKARAIVGFDIVLKSEESSG